MLRSYFVLLTVMLLFSCKEEESGRTDENLAQHLSTGVWEISYFEVNGAIRTEEFQGIDFIFYPDGKAETYRETQLLQQGTWQTYVQSEKIKLELSFPQLQLLNGIWEQDFIRESQVKVKKESTKTLLILEKI